MVFEDYLVMLPIAMQTMAAYEPGTFPGASAMSARGCQRSQRVLVARP